MREKMKTEKWSGRQETVFPEHIKGMGRVSDAQAAANSSE